MQFLEKQKQLFMLADSDSKTVIDSFRIWYAIYKMN